MPDQLQLRGGTTAEHSTFTGAIKEVTVDTTKKTAVVHDGTTAGGIALLRQDGSNSALALGSEGTPSLKWDANTGIFSPGDDQLAIVTGANRAITCTSTQAVGIKTANPNAALHVAGSTRVGADSAADAILEIGEGATGNRSSYIDIVADTTYTDYGLRVIRNNTGANATSELKHRGTGALNITTQEAAAIIFNTTNSPQVTIDSSGRLLVGTSTAATTDNNANSPNIQLEGASGDASRMLIRCNGGTTAGNSGFLYIARSRGTTANSKDVVVANDSLGGIIFEGTDGTHDRRAASILAEVDGTPAGPSPGPVSMPGRLVFSTTPDSGSSPTSSPPAMTIKSSQEVLIGTSTITANGGILQLKSGITFPATPVAATDVNTLDDYEEGTWAATITPQTSGTITLSADTGHYVKIGKQVVVTSKLAVSAVSTPLGFVKISLPFNSGANAQGSFSAIMENTVSTGAANFWSIVPASSNSLEVYLAAANNPSATSAAQFQAGSTVWLTATYFV